MLTASILVDHITLRLPFSNLFEHRTKDEKEKRPERGENDFETVELHSIFFILLR